jgi:hypothetical protein
MLHEKSDLQYLVTRRARKEQRKRGKGRRKEEIGRDE